MIDLEPASITLGILAGGRATRLGGLDKAWLLCDGMPQVLRLLQWSGPQVGAVVVSANRGLDRYATAGLRVVVDRLADIGPLGGIEALAAICSTSWLLTLPVDVVHLDTGLLPGLRAAGPEGAAAQDRDGLQP
ncbi:MAG TPA: NTP transferase domain-containing protein, partial [Xanthomonadaceae bacterium]|nr:NTP transferase domain-containing protein [Xanthomonadaceae bacterium]